MNIEQIFVLAIFLATILALIFTNKRPATIFSASVLLLLLSKQLSFNEVLVNLTNQGLVALVLLLIVSTSIDKTAFIKRLGRAIINKSFAKSFWKMFALAFSSSAMLNNTAIVASLIGPLKQNQIHAPSKLLIPLSYAAILGGTVTLIGTSTNLIVDSFLIEHGQPGFNFFDFTLFGLTAGLACGVLLYFLTPLLPVFSGNKANYHSYFIEASVAAESELIGKTVEQNHLRNLPELFLIEVVRKGKIISPVKPDFVIEQADKLIFSGNIQKMDSLAHIKGLTTFAESDGLMRENLTEVIVSNRAPIINKTLKQVGFRALFDAAVVAIRRDGEQISGKMGDIQLKAGDFLLLAAGNDFQNRDNIIKNFFVVSEQQISRKLTPMQENATLLGFVASIAIAAFTSVPLANSLLFFTAILVALKINSLAEIKRNLPLHLILVIVGALSLATSLENSGVLGLMTNAVTPFIGDSNPLIALIVVYLLTLLLTEFVTNNAAAALMFPFAYGLVQALNLPLMPFSLAVAFAASASFISPYGYQTNLIVFSATDYKFKDFIKLGLPISITYSTIVIMLLNWVYL